MKYTYLLLHPSSNILIAQILTELKKENFSIIGIYKISEWDKVLDDIYRNTYSVSDTVQRHVKAHAYINKYFFGNNGILILLHKDIMYSKLIRETLDIKKRIRKNRKETKEGRISIYVNMGKCLGEEYNTDEKDNIFMSYLHCPDTEEQYEEDFITLSGYLKSDNRLNNEQVQRMVQYLSYQ